MRIANRQHRRAFTNVHQQSIVGEAGANQIQTKTVEKTRTDKQEKRKKTKKKQTKKKNNCTLYESDHLPI